MAANWAVWEFFIGACSSDGSIEVTANDGGGICWAFAYNSTQFCQCCFLFVLVVARTW
jgi:hypothetical protein